MGSRYPYSLLLLVSFLAAGTHGGVLDATVDLVQGLHRLARPAAQRTSVPAAAGKAAAAAAATGDAIIATRPCQWPLLVTDSEQLRSSPVITSCSQLSGDSRAGCLRCAAITSRERCLATPAVEWAGADTDSCVWNAALAPSLGPNARRAGSSSGPASRHMRYSVGVNAADTLYTRLARSTCKVAVRWETSLPLQQLYQVAQFGAALGGWNSTGGVIPPGQATEARCILTKGGRHRCSAEFPRSRSHQWLSLSRQVWTNSPQVVAALARTNDTCLQGGTCAHYPVTFEYAVTLTEIPCRLRTQPGTAVSNTGPTRFTEPSTLVYPGGKSVYQRYSAGRRLLGLRAVRWHVRASKAPLLVFLAPWEAILMPLGDLCQPDSASPGFVTCDITQLRNVSLPGTYCQTEPATARNPGGKGCGGTIPKLGDSDLVLLATYRTYRFNTSDFAQIVDPNATPAQDIDMDITGSF